MIQRIQTVYLLLSVVCCALCLWFPLGEFSSDGLGQFPAVINNVCVIGGDKAIVSYLPISLFVLLSLAVAFSILAIFGYSNRRRQMRLCSTVIVLLLLWVVNLSGYALWLVPGTKFVPGWQAALPVVGVILAWLARRGVRKDDELIRATDRIR